MGLSSLSAVSLGAHLPVFSERNQIFRESCILYSYIPVSGADSASGQGCHTGWSDERHHILHQARVALAKKCQCKLYHCIFIEPSQLLNYSVLIQCF